ncbi:MAG: 2-isopropylmalate synthase [Ruminococcaceae bacterium]|nr:2-isopropylmalate synthase [Oscillospiraceae bacterium]
MINLSKYSPRFYPIENPTRKWATKTHIEKSPIWCSVDLRDGNQSLVVPMSLEEKLDYFKLLTDIGFKEIEVGFPAANETEFTFLRTLIEKDLIPDDVTVQVLTQSREHIIERTFDALEGCKNAIVHLYNSTSVAQREQVFRMSREEITDLAREGARTFLRIAEERGVNYRYEYSPESFTGTEPDFALEICNAVLDVWQPTPEKKVIINLPVTVELSSPHIYADQVEFMCDNLKYRDSVIVSLHPHNDRGCAVADAELGLLAGADRVEGTLFGNGERTGNLDIITLALNMYSHGVDPLLDLSNIPALVEAYEKATRMQVYDRQPYSGKLVFAAFSGSHQDAIAKGIKWREENDVTNWDVPYIPIDPRDIGREYETDVIRINSQSGKGGIGYLLEHNFGYSLPATMRQDVGATVKSLSDDAHAELSPEQVHKIFTENYVNVNDHIKLIDYHFVRKPMISVALTVEIDGTERHLQATGNGRLDAVSNAVKKQLGIKFSELTYEEHALTKGSSSQAITYVSITLEGGRKVWGAGIHDDIIASSINALFSAINRSIAD